MPYQLNADSKTVVYWYGEPKSGFRLQGQHKGCGQSYHDIKSRLLDQSELFTDDQFPPCDSSIFTSSESEIGQKLAGHVEWLRPHEIVKDEEEPQFIQDGASRFDVQQGALGDCWFVSAVALLPQNDSVFRQVIPDDNGDFVGEAGGYRGIFHFRFWQFGRWIDVAVDDRLPTRNGRLIFLKSATGTEFWSALIEKAYAKLHGCYEALVSGHTYDALEDFTGGVVEVLRSFEEEKDLFGTLKKALTKSSLMGCSVSNSEQMGEVATEEGLIQNHAYAITDVKVLQLDTEGGEVTPLSLVRIRNPWGQGEWKGDWSDGSALWDSVTEEQKNEIGYVSGVDGEFWMSAEDFEKYFGSLDIVNLSPESTINVDGGEEGRKTFDVSQLEGKWTKGATAGGSYWDGEAEKNCWDTFALNPQYMIKLTDPDPDDDEENCTVIIALMQKHRRAQRAKNLAISFAVYKLDPEETYPTPLDKNYFEQHRRHAGGEYSYSREVTSRFKWPPGTYCIVPFTTKVGDEAEFVIRIFSETKDCMRENDDEIGLGVKKTNDESDSDSVDKEEISEDAIQLLRNHFQEVAGEDGEIDHEELQQVLNLAAEDDDFELSSEVCRSLVALKDVDRTGKLGLQEFIELWSDVEDWFNVFKEFDHDDSGTLCTTELRNALLSAGYRVNNQILQSFVIRYGNKERQLSLNNFILFTVKLKTMIEIFQQHQRTDGTTAEFTLGEWIDSALYS